MHTWRKKKKKRFRRAKREEKTDKTILKFHCERKKKKEFISRNFLIFFFWNDEFEITTEPVVVYFMTDRHGLRATVGLYSLGYCNLVRECICFACEYIILFFLFHFFFVALPNHWVFDFIFYAIIECSWSVWDEMCFMIVLCCVGLVIDNDKPNRANHERKNLICTKQTISSETITTLLFFLSPSLHLSLSFILPFNVDLIDVTVITERSETSLKCLIKKWNKVRTSKIFSKIYIFSIPIVSVFDTDGNRHLSGNI